MFYGGVHHILYRVVKGRSPRNILMNSNTVFDNVLLMVYFLAAPYTPYNVEIVAHTSAGGGEPNVQIVYTKEKGV